MTMTTKNQNLQPLLSLARRPVLNRWRILNRETDEVVEISSHSFFGACAYLKWDPTRCMAILVGKLSILTIPKRYVRPQPDTEKG